MRASAAEQQPAAISSKGCIKSFDLQYTHVTTRRRRLASPRFPRHPPRPWINTLRQGWTSLGATSDKAPNMFVFHARDQTATLHLVVYAASKCNIPTLTRGFVSGERRVDHPWTAKVRSSRRSPYFLSSHICFARTAWRRELFRPPNASREASETDGCETACMTSHAVEFVQ